MIDFINGKTKIAVFNINDITIELAKGDEKKALNIYF